MFRAHEHVFTWRAERARLEPAFDSRHGSVRFSLMPMPGAAPLSAAFVRRCVEHARDQGGSEIVTPAVTAHEAAGLRDAGFLERAALHLLVHDLDPIPDERRVRAEAAYRRAVPGDRAAILRVDEAAFGPDWCLDGGGLREAVNATPRVRVRVADDRRLGSTIGFAVTGRAGRRGYLQRLAVDPIVHGNGIGRALVVDALRWSKRWRVSRVVVNTQIGNHVAYGMYRKLGFVDAPIGLYVLHLPLLQPDIESTAPDGSRGPR